MFVKFFGLSRSRNNWENVSIAKDCVAALVWTFKESKGDCDDMIVTITLKNGVENQWEIFKDEDKNRIRQFGE